MARDCEAWKAATRTALGTTACCCLDSCAALKAEAGIDDLRPLEKQRLAGAAAKAWRNTWGRNAAAIARTGSGSGSGDGDRMEMD